MSEVQVDLLAYMATVETGNKPLGMCPSCQRALLYAGMLYASDASIELDKALNTGDMQYVFRAIRSLRSVQQFFGDFARADIYASFPGVTDLSQEQWGIAIESFVQARTEAYVNPDGTLRPHDHGHGGSGVPAVTP